MHAHLVGHVGLPGDVLATAVVDPPADADVAGHPLGAGHRRIGGGGVLFSPQVFGRVVLQSRIHAVWACRFPDDCDASPKPFKCSQDFGPKPPPQTLFLARQRRG